MDFIKVVKYHLNFKNVRIFYLFFDGLCRVLGKQISTPCSRIIAPYDFGLELKIKIKELHTKDKFVIQINFIDFASRCQRACKYRFLSQIFFSVWFCSIFL